MKMKKVLCILGVAAALGTAAYVIWQMQKKENKTIGTRVFEKQTNKISSSASSIDKSKKTAVEDDFVTSKRHEAAVVITDRHNEATQIIRDSVDAICNRSIISEDENFDLEQISNELDDLLRED